jgi:hypothetical protein
MDIRDLKLFPIEYASEEERQVLEERGKIYWRLRTATFLAYTGSDVPGETVFKNSRMMVDYQTYRRIQPDADAFVFDEYPAPPPRFRRIPYNQPPNEDPPLVFDNWQVDLELSGEPTPLIRLLMPPHAYACNLGNKKWQHIWVDGIKDIEWNKTAFDRLVLPPKVKELVKTLVLVRKSGDSANPGMSLAGQRKDLIRGKGDGLVMLLHGGPGTGKTLTAESVAELAEMPLYSVTCGDLRTRPEEVELYLEGHFFLSKSWNCVLLLDDADVFLEERSLSDLGRNSLVAIFLRMLEYYEGILILTSNRIGTFDEAFKSRIQVALHYPTLDMRSRRSIWLNFFEMLEEDEADVDLGGLRSRLEELADFEINGRQIRNVLTTARQLALYKKETLCWEHLEVSIKTVTDFNLYIRRLQGHTDEQWAREEKLR